MGLQFIDANGNERTLTEADMLTPDFQDSYSDLHKGLHGFRPRYSTPEQMLRFFGDYEEAMEAHLAQEAAELIRLSERDGIAYRNWFHYYDEQERRDYEDYERQRIEREKQQARKAEMMRRGSPLPVIEDWDYGVAA